MSRLNWRDGWSDEELAYLSKNYTSETWPEISKALDKPIGTVRYAARKLGLSKDGKERTLRGHFETKHTKTSSCWNWTGPIRDDGYGCFQNREVYHFAHRLSWILNVGPIGPEQNVLHTCDNRRCVNPEHLYLGSHKDNMLDRERRGRNGQRKLSRSDVEEIRHRADAGETQASIAEDFPVGRSHISEIASRKKWAWLPDG